MEVNSFSSFDLWQLSDMDSATISQGLDKMKISKAKSEKKTYLHIFNMFLIRILENSNFSTGQRGKCLGSYYKLWPCLL